MIADFIGGPWHLQTKTFAEVRSCFACYRLVICTATFLVYVQRGTPLNQDLFDPVRYFFAREVRFQEEMHGWTHHNTDFGLASAEGILGMMAIMRFRKRKT
jgi:hypothetical protein